MESLHLRLNKYDSFNIISFIVVSLLNIAWIRELFIRKYKQLTYC